MSKTYYFSSKKRRFEDGSRQRPYSSLDVLATLDLQDGATIALSRNSVFEGQFIHLFGKTDISIISYGHGAKPVIDAKGKGIWHQDFGQRLDNPNHRYNEDVSSTILLFDCSGVTIKDIEIRNSGVPENQYYDALRMCRTGIAAVAQNKGRISGFLLEDLTVCSVEGNIYDKHLCNGGIYFVCHKPSAENAEPACFDNIHIARCLVKNVSRWGISIGYTYLWEKFAGTHTSVEVFEKYGNTNILVEDTYVKNVGGDAITALYALRPVIRACRADSACSQMNDRSYKYPLERQGKVAAAVWAWKSLDAYFEHNEVYDSRLNQDGMAYDADSGWNSKFKHNYSHSNEGGSAMFCLEEALGSVFEDNISDDDLGGILSPADCPDGTIQNNRIYRRESVPLLRNRMSGGTFVCQNNDEIIITRKR